MNTVRVIKTCHFFACTVQTFAQYFMTRTAYMYTCNAMYDTMYTVYKHVTFKKIAPPYKNSSYAILDHCKRRKYGIRQNANVWWIFYRHTKISVRCNRGAMVNELGSRLKGRGFDSTTDKRHWCVRKGHSDTKCTAPPKGEKIGSTRFLTLKGCSELHQEKKS